MPKKSLAKWQFGDFQTPDSLAQEIIKTLKRKHGVKPSVIIEPTCGKGAFIRACLNAFVQVQIIGFDINESYVLDAKASISGYTTTNQVTIEQADFFTTNWEEILRAHPGNLLVVGNPPWVTSSELSILNSENIPSKSNFQNRRGIEAVTGSGNFDISEWMLLRHIDWLTNREGVIALLCKYAVARKVMRQVREKGDQRFFGQIYLIDSKKYFGAAVEACLFVLTTDHGNTDCEIYNGLDTQVPSYIIGERDGFIVKDTITYEKWRHLIERDSHYTWRSGVKHDCAQIMELETSGPQFINGLDERVDLETKYLYPLLKSSDIGNGRVHTYRKMILLTQKIVGEDTRAIAITAPKTWKYLDNHKEYFEKRASSIYKHRPPYSVFGVGPYTLKPWKVAISGLYKKLAFAIIGPLDDKPVIFDDTIYFLSFDTEKEAQFVFELVTSQPALQALESMIFWDEKRPITSAILSRLSLRAVAEELGLQEQYLHWTEEASKTGVGQLSLGIG